MASTINAKTTGVGGIDASGDASGVLALQTGGTTAVTIDASQNVTTSANLTYTGTLTGSTGILNIGSGQVYKDASGNVGIGTSSPATILDVVSSGNPTLTLRGSAGAYTSYLKLQAAGGGGSVINATGATSDSLQFQTTGTERARIDSSGNLLVGTTRAFGSGKVCIQSNTPLALKGSTSSNCGDIDFLRADTSARAWTIGPNANDFYISNANFTKYTYLLTQNFTAWTFASDRRIKNNIEDLSYGLNEVLKIKPRQFNYISDNQHDIGFIAQELQTVIPEAVSGSEILYDDADTPQERASKTMGVSKDALIPVLVKAIQEQQTLIEALTARLTALEAK